MSLALSWSTGEAKGPPGRNVDSIFAAQQAKENVGRFEKIDQRAFDLYVNALLMEFSGDLLTASQLYERALDYFPQSYEIRFSLAASLYNMRRPREALDQIKKLKALDGPAYGLAAACYRVIGDITAAATAYHRQTQFDSTSLAAYSFLSEYYRNSNQLDSAVWAYHNLARILPENVQILNDLGRLQVQRGHFDSALAVFGQSVAIRGDTSNAPAIVGLAETYEMTDHLDSASAVLERSVSLSPDYVPYRQSLINLYARMDLYAQALPHARMIALRFPDDGFAARRLGILYFSLDSLEKSDSIFTSRVKAGEALPMNHYYLGRAELVRRNWPKAAEQFERMTQLSDTSATAWISLSVAYRQMGENDRAIETLRTATERVRGEKPALDVYYALGSAYEQVGNVDSATAVFEKLIENAPNFAQAMNYLGYMLADRNLRLDYAKELIARAIELEPTNAAYLDSYGWVLYRQGIFDDALGYLRRAADLQADPTVFDHLGDVYQKLNQPDSARAWWEKALNLQPDNALIKEKLKK